MEQLPYFTPIPGEVAQCVNKDQTYLDELIVDSKSDWQIF